MCKWKMKIIVCQKWEKTKTCYYQRIKMNVGYQ